MIYTVDDFKFKPGKQGYYAIPEYIVIQCFKNQKQLTHTLAELEKEIAACYAIINQNKCDGEHYRQLYKLQGLHKAQHLLQIEL